MTNPYGKNLSTAFKTLSKNVKGDANAERALQMLRQHITRKTPRTKTKTAKTYGIEPTHIVRQSSKFISGERVPRSFNILQMIQGVGRTVAIVKKELGICEANLNYFRKWGYITLEKRAS